MPRTHLFPASPLLLAAALSARTLLPFALDVFANDPETRIEDAYKWLFQAASGGEHAVPDGESARAWLRKEWASLGETAPGEPLLVPLRPDGGLVRLNLRPYRDRGGKPDDLAAAFLESARTFGPDPVLFLESWTVLGEELAARPLGPLNRAEWSRLDAAMKARGYPAVHHSEGFTRTRRPAYRVLAGEDAVRLASLLPSAAQTPAPAPDPLEASVAALMKVDSATSPSFSPDGKRIAFVSTASGQPQVWIVPAEGGTPAPLIRTEDPAGPVAWSPDGSRVAYVLAPGGGMNTQVWIANPDGSNPKRLTDGGSETNRLGPFRKDGKALAIASNRRYRTHIDAWIWDAGSGALSLAAQNRGSGGIVDFSSDGKRFLLQRSPQRGHSDLYLVDIETKAETHLTPHEGPAGYLGRLAPDGRSVYVATNAGREMTAFGRIDLSEGKPGPFEVLAARDDAELSTFAIDEAGTRAVLLWNVSGRSELALYDLNKKTLAPGPPLPAEVAGGLSLSRDGAKLALALSGSTRPSDIWVLDLKTGRFSQVTKSAHDGVDLAALVSPELVKVTAFDGKPLWSWLYRAKGSGPGPLVLSFHGGPEGQETPSFRPDYQALLAQGISVLAPNVRGSSGFGRSFLALDNQGKRVNVMRDVKACRDWAVEQKIADPVRVGIMGGSYGGWVTVAALTAFPDDFAAGADLYGIVNFLSFFEKTEPWMAEISKAEYGDPDRQAELLTNLSPLFKVRHVKAPVLVLHGRNDTNVPVAEATQLVEELKARKIPVEYVLFPDEGHGFRKLPNRIRANVALVRWFEKYLEAAGTK